MVASTKRSVGSQQEPADQGNVLARLKVTAWLHWPNSSDTGTWAAALQPALSWNDPTGLSFDYECIRQKFQHNYYQEPWTVQFYGTSGENAKQYKNFKLSDKVLYIIWGSIYCNVAGKNKYHSLRANRFEIWLPQED